MNPKKCSPKKNGYAEILCDPLMKSIADHAPSKRKGILKGTMINIKTLEEEGECISLVSGEFKNGIVLNYCPFCGGHLRDLTND